MRRANDWPNKADILADRRLAGNLYAAAATTGVIAIVVPHWQETNEKWAIVLAVLTYSAAAYMRFGTKPLPQLLMYIVPLPATFFVTFAVWVNGPGAGGATMASFYVMLGLGAFSILPPIVGATYIVIATISYAGLLIHWGVDAWPAQVVMMTGTSFSASYAAGALFRRIRDLAWQDELTGLANRRAWYQTLDIELARAKRRGETLSVAIIDLDHFKGVNDAGGHVAGDELLRGVANLWRESLRPSDSLARWGGDEFALIFPDCSHDHGADVVERLRAGMPNGQTFSAGLATWDRNESIDALVQRADAALYESKDAGRATTTTSIAPRAS